VKDGVKAIVAERGSIEGLVNNAGGQYRPAAGNLQERLGGGRRQQPHRRLSSGARSVQPIKERAATAECVNAAARNRGLQRFVVRGHDKALSIALLFAIAHNLARLFALSAPTMT